MTRLQFDELSHLEQHLLDRLVWTVNDLDDRTGITRLGNAARSAGLPELFDEDLDRLLNERRTHERWLKLVDPASREQISNTHVGSP